MQAADSKESDSIRHKFCRGTVALWHSLCNWLFLNDLCRFEEGQECQSVIQLFKKSSPEGLLYGVSRWLRTRVQGRGRWDRRSV